MRASLSLVLGLWLAAAGASWAAGAAAPARSASWSRRGLSELVRRVPAVGRLGVDLGDRRAGLALRRIFGDDGTVARLEKLPAGEQAAAARLEIERYAAAAADSALALAEPGRPSVRRLYRLEERAYALEDASALLPALPDAASWGRRLAAARDGLARRQREESERLYAEALRQLGGEGRPEEYGRTLVVPVEGGKVALKLSRSKEADPGALIRDAAMMREAGRAGLFAPVPLPPPRGKVRVQSLPGREGEGPRFVHAYALSDELADRFFSYLGDPLPGEAPHRRLERVREAALRSIDDQIRLSLYGLVHTSLAPLSHSTRGWDWDFWRWTISMFGEPNRWGATSIHGWREALSYANVRETGLADYEHIAPLAEAPTREGLTRDVAAFIDDPAAFRLGQNLTEWSLLVLRAGSENELAQADISELLVEGIERRLAGERDGAGAGLTPEQRAAVAETTRRFYRFAAVDRALPGWLKFSANAAVHAVSFPWSRPSAEDLMLPGGVLDPLILKVLREQVSTLGPRPPPKAKARMAVAVAVSMFSGSVFGIFPIALFLALAKLVLGRFPVELGLWPFFAAAGIVAWVVLSRWPLMRREWRGKNPPTRR